MIQKIAPLIILLAWVLQAGAQSSTDTTAVHTMQGTFYSDQFVGRKTSSGEVFKQDKYTAAHRSFEFGTLLLVTNPSNGQQVIVRVNDRCPKRGVIDLTRKGAKSIGITSHTVTVQVLPKRFICYWEIQDELQELMKSGQFLRSIGYSPTAKKRGHNSKAKPATEPITLYDLELCIADSKSAAEKAIALLPIYYRDKVEISPTATGHTYAVHLLLSAKIEKAEQIHTELYNLFPHNRPIKAN